jgi:hypothetical protein
VEACAYQQFYAPRLKKYGYRGRFQAGKAKERVGNAIFILCSLYILQTVLTLYSRLYSLHSLYAHHILPPYSLHTHRWGTRYSS